MPREVALVACGLGALLLVLGLRMSRLGRDTLAFTRTRGSVLVSRVEEMPGPEEAGGTRFAAVIRYGFEARGRRYESDRISAGAPAGAASSDAQDARRLVARYPAGSAVDVWFDPADPGRSVLERGTATAQAAVAVVVGLGLCAVGFFALRR